MSRNLVQIFKIGFVSTNSKSAVPIIILAQSANHVPEEALKTSAIPMESAKYDLYTISNLLKLLILIN